MEHSLEFRDINKSFPGVQALADVSFRVTGGKVIALMGENGAGKSTLLKILSGDIRSDSGEILMDGEPLELQSPHDAIVRGIGVIYQERQLMPALSVMENVFIGALPTKGRGRVDYNSLRLKTRELLELFGMPISPDESVGGLSVAHQQMVEIMKTYRRMPNVIAFDEPTAPLTDTEIKTLFRVIEDLKRQGKIILYVSHRMTEIFQITDEIIVLKDGRLAATMETAQTQEQELIKAMVGRDIGDTYAGLERGGQTGDVLLEVEGLTTEKLKNVSFQLRKGEILGFAGLAGSGRTEVARAIFGADPIVSGSIRLNGSDVRFRSPKDAIKAGIALCPEDRKEQGLVLSRSIRDNVCMPVLEKLKKGLFLDTGACTALAEGAVERYAIKTPTVEKTVVELSGGNQQKVILGRWTSELVDTCMLILDEPTKGIDVNTKAEIYQTVCEFARQGLGVIFISSELTEVLNLADRVAVMHDGGLAGILGRDEATEENVMSLAMLNRKEALS